MVSRTLVTLLAATTLLAAAWAASPRVLPNGQTTRIEATGEVGAVLTVEASDQLQQPKWDVLSSSILTNRSATVIDAWCGGKPQRFYRIKQSTDPDYRRAANFRLTDHQDRSHELYYLAPAEEVKAFVLIFASNGCADLEQQLATIKDLQARFAPQGVVFWMINSNPGDTRATIASEAARLGINFPVLHDRAQTVARLYAASKAAEIVCIDREDMGIFYRGALDDAEWSNGQPTRNFLEEALAARVSGKRPQTLETKAAGCDVPAIASGELAYSTVVAPLLQAKCVSCHSPGNVAPWSMTNYNIVRAYSSLIRAKVASKEMPPWHADPNYGRFKNNFSMSPAEEKILVDWTLAGSPRGTGPDPLEVVPPPPPRWPVELGEPDLILRTPPQKVEANGVEPYRYIFVDTGLAEAKWLKAAIVKPTNTRVVHHYLVWEGKSMSQMATGLAGYVPGMQDLAFPEGTGVQLQAGGAVTFNLHYTPSGQEEMDQPELALWFHKTPPAKTLITLPLVHQSFRIPPGAREFTIRAEPPALLNPLPVSITLYGMAPHMHLRGASMTFHIRYPNGQTEVLLSVPKYHFNWQTRYLLAEPKVIPAGSRVWLTGSFDNSMLNMHNPDPTKEVLWGEQSWEEMFIGYFDVTL
jgi:hypothetical protein